MELAVIVRVPEGAGNLAMANTLYSEVERPDESNGYLGKWEPYRRIDVMLSFRQEVFYLGEVMILDSNGREPGGHGRKPDKWDVKVEYFADIVSAGNRSREVVETENKRRAAEREAAED